jgi:bla regulator protein blaR1
MLELLIESALRSIMLSAAVKLARGSAGIYLEADGRIEDFNFYPSGDGRPGGIASCALEASPGAIPIKLSLTNRSGAEVRLFWLNSAGKRVPSGTIENDASTNIWTGNCRPYVVTDLADQCREIVLPGEVTRFHVIELPGVSVAPRASPLPSGDAALARLIEGVRRGAPEYDRMTPEAAAETRLHLSGQQAMLARLGALRQTIFRGVSGAGNDIYTIRFANGSAVWQIGLVDGGRIGAVALGP